MSIVSILCSFVEAKTLDAIAVIVNGRPITTSEIAKVARMAHISEKEAIELLIQDRLQQIAMKDIVVTDDMVDAEIAKIAKHYRMDIPSLRKALEKEGTSWHTYRDSIRTSLKQKLFFRDHIAKRIPQPSEVELRSYYENHLDEFVLPARFRVVTYRFSSQKEADKFVSGATRKTPKGKKQTLQTASLNPAMLDLLLRTPEGKLTEPINSGSGYVVYKVLAKEGKRRLSFEEAKEAVAGRWQVKHREEAVKNYFKRMKADADIRYLRK